MLRRAHPGLRPGHSREGDCVIHISHPLGGMMLNWLGEKRGDERLKRAWRGIDGAVDMVLSEGRVRTPDLKGASGTQQFGDAIVQALLVIAS